MANNPAHIAEALSQLGAMVGGRLPTFGSGDVVQPVMVVQDLSRSLAIEPFERRGYCALVKYNSTPTRWWFSIRPVTGTGLVVERANFYARSDGALVGAEPTLRLSTSPRDDFLPSIPTTEVISVGGGSPRAAIRSLDNAFSFGDVVNLRFVNEDTTATTFRGGWQGHDLRWFVPPDQSLSWGFGAAGTQYDFWWDVTWREVPDL